MRAVLSALRILEDVDTTESGQGCIECLCSCNTIYADIQEARKQIPSSHRKIQKS